MKINRIILLLACLGLATTAVAQEINRTLDADPESRLTISNTAGSVDVEGWSRNEVEVTGTLGRNVDELVFERDGDEIIIKVEVRRRSSSGVSSNLDIKVPEGSALEIHTVSADIDVENVRGEQQIESVSGDIATVGHAEDIEVNSVSGDIEINGNGAAMRSRLNSVSGDIETDNLAGEISAESVSGGLLVANGEFRRAFAHTVNGEIIFHSKLMEDGRLEIETINGEVDVDFGGDVSARIDIETFNGEIRNCFGPDPVRTSKYAPGLELKFTEGNGSGRITIETLNGDIRICR